MLDQSRLFHGHARRAIHSVVRQRELKTKAVIDFLQALHFGFIPCCSVSEVNEPMCFSCHMIQTISAALIARANTAGLVSIIPDGLCALPGRIRVFAPPECKEADEIQSPKLFTRRVDLYPWLQPLVAALIAVRRAAIISRTRAVVGPRHSGCGLRLCYVRLLTSAENFVPKKSGPHPEIQNG
jgi:hypothetical protein